jgi:hypothetical protein
MLPSPCLIFPISSPCYFPFRRSACMHHVRSQSSTGMLCYQRGLSSRRNSAGWSGRSQKTYARPDLGRPFPCVTLVPADQGEAGVKRAGKDRAGVKRQGLRPGVRLATSTTASFFDPLLPGEIRRLEMGWLVVRFAVWGWLQKRPLWMYVRAVSPGP